MALPRRYTRLRNEIHVATLVAFAAKTAARLRTYFYVPPKLVNVKHTNQLQTVNLPHQGWRGVAQ